MQCMGNSAFFFLGKASNHTTVLPSIFLPCVQSFCVSIPPAVRPAVFFMTDGYGVFNVRTNLGACHTHKGRSGANKSAQELTGRDRRTLPLPLPLTLTLTLTLLLTLPHQGIGPRVFWFEFRLSNHWATPPDWVYVWGVGIGEVEWVCMHGGSIYVCSQCVCCLHLMICDTCVCLYVCLWYGCVYVVVLMYFCLMTDY